MLPKNAELTLYDHKVPEKLRFTQQWFGSIISRRINEQNHMLSVSPLGIPMDIEAADYIVASPTLEPWQRIELYNQQYWWRLLNSLHEIFPFTTRLFGHYSFNQHIGFPFLELFPPKNWELHGIGNTLPQWIQECYRKKDKNLILNAAQLDLAFNNSFIANQLPSITMESLPIPGDLSSILDRKLVLQPHVHLFEFSSHLLEFRYDFLKEAVEYWEAHDFPALNKEGPFFFIVCRSPRLFVTWKEVSKYEYLLLDYLREGHSIDDVCEWLEKQEDHFVEAVSEKLSEWIQGWIILGLLSLNQHDSQPYQKTT